MTQQLIDRTIELLRDEPELIEACRRSPGNTIVGGAISIALGTPRQYAEAAVQAAIERLERP